MSTFDALSSVAYMLVGVMAPYEAGVYLSRGNETTCNIQGFMVQLGQTASMLYNLFLSLYFLLIIVYGWREARFKKMSIWVHAFVVLSGMGLAVAAIPFIEAQFGVCGILPPLTSSRWQISLFYTGPVSTVLFVLTVSTVAICRSVYMQERRAKKWKFGKANLSMTREVFWQSFWYVSAFYVTIPLMLVAFYAPFKYPRGFWISIVTAILAPLQGLMNAMVFFQRSKKDLIFSCSKAFERMRRLFRCIRLESILSVWMKKPDKLTSASGDDSVAENNEGEASQEEEANQEATGDAQQVEDGASCAVLPEQDLPVPATVIFGQGEANNDSESEMSCDELEEHHAVMHYSVSEFWKLNEPTRTFDAEPTSMGGRSS